MDGELFRWVLLGLLALGLLVLIALLATLGGIKKALEQRETTRASGSGVWSGTAQAGSPSEQAPAGGARPAQAATYPPAEAAAAAEPGAASGGGGRADSIRSVLEHHGLSEGAAASDEPQPAAQSAAADPGEERTVTDSVFAAHADDPQEEPFQRDGRWWFRRGDELLLYDEASGQWQPAPSASGSAPAAAQEGIAASSGATTGVQTTPVSEAPAVADQVSSFWKCPTCGAVNGSTAATCRMCFAARP